MAGGQGGGGEARGAGRRVKFGAFLEHLEADHPGRFDRVASGHYAAVSRDGAGAAVLSAASDPVKDQTYFLAFLSQVAPFAAPTSSPWQPHAYPGD